MAERAPAGCDREGAMRYLGACEKRFETLLSEKKIRPLGRNWFAYADLDETIERLRKDRDKVVVLNGEKADSGLPSEQKRNEVGSQGSRPHRTTEELLREHSAGSL